MNIIRELRKKQQLTQIQLSKLLNIDQTTVSKWELDKAIPDINSLIKLSNLFDVSIDFLLGRSDFYYPDRLPSPTAHALADDERKLLDYYGQMSHPQKIRVIAYCEGMLSTEQSVSSKRNA